MNATLVLLSLFLLVGQGGGNPNQTLQVTEITKDLNRLTTPYFTIEAPSSLFYDADKSGSSLSFEPSRRQSPAGFDISVLPLESVNGYNREWNDLVGFFKWTKQPLIMKRIASYEWAYGETGDQKEIVVRTYLQFRHGLYVQVTYNYPTRYQQLFGDMFEAMLKSVTLNK